MAAVRKATTTTTRTKGPGPGWRARVSALPTVRDGLPPRLDAFRQRVRPALVGAGAQIGPALDDARERVGPAFDDARERWRESVVPAVTAVVETAWDRSAPARAEALQRSRGALAAVRGEDPSPTRNRWRPSLLALLVGVALGAFVATVARRAAGVRAQPAPQPGPQPGPAAEQPDATSPATLPE